MKTPTLIVVLLALAAPALADAPVAAEAKQHLDLAIRHYAAKRYEDAITEFRAAYERDARGEILFSWAQAERLSGDCPSAVVLYRKFLATGPGAREAEAGRLNLKKCEDALGSQPEPTPATPPAAPVASPSVAVIAAKPAPAAPLRWQRDPAGLTLVAVGGLGVVLGVALAGASAALAGNVSGASSYSDYSARLDQAQGVRTGGLVTLGVGVAVGLAGAIRLGLVARRKPTAAAWLRPRANGVAVAF